MKVITFLLFIIFAFNGDTTYSIDALLDYLQESGYYEIIYQVKIYFGNDFAIDFCKEIVKTNQCQEVVTVYMAYSSSPSYMQHCPKIPQINHEINPKPSNRFIEILKRLYNDASPDIQTLIIIIYNNYDILIRKMTEPEILQLIEDFITNYGRKIKLICPSSN